MAFYTEIRREILSDASFVYRVAFVDDGETLLEIDAVSLRDAESLADKVHGAFKTHALLCVGGAVRFTF